MSLFAPVKKPRFICEVCEAEVPLDAKSCPYCGQVFAATLCPSCGFSGEAALFESGCPSCGYRIDGGKPSPPKEFSPPAAVIPEAEDASPGRSRSRVWYTHFSYYLLALAVFIALIAALIFNML